MVDIIILNPIGHFEVDVDSSFFCFDGHFGFKIYPMQIQIYEMEFKFN